MQFDGLVNWVVGLSVVGDQQFYFVVVFSDGVLKSVRSEYFLEFVVEVVDGGYFVIRYDDVVYGVVFIRLQFGCVEKDVI